MRKGGAAGKKSQDTVCRQIKVKQEEKLNVRGRGGALGPESGKKGRNGLRLRTG